MGFINVLDFNPMQTMGANQFSWFALFYKVNYGTIFNLFLFVCIMGITYYIARYLTARSPYAAPYQTGKVKERIYLSPQTTMVIVELQGCFYVLVTDKGKTTVVDKRNDLYYPSLSTPTMQNDFKAVLNKIRNKNKHQ